MVDLGLGSAAQRFIPEYTEHKSFALLRGFLGGSRWLALLFGTIAGAAGAIAVRALTPLHRPGDGRSAVHFLRGAAAVWRLVGAERHRPLLQLGQSRIVAGLRAASALAAGADGACLCARAADRRDHRDRRRRLCACQRRPRPSHRSQSPAGRRRRTRPEGLRGAHLADHLGADLPGRSVLLFAQLIPTSSCSSSSARPNDVAIYYAAAKTIALVAFIYYSVAQTIAHKFVEYDVSGDRVAAHRLP